MKVAEAVRRARSGERLALARAISMIEDRAPEILAALGEVEPRRLRAPGLPRVIGVTGPPGAGKSTFVDRLVGLAREQGRRVAVVAVDPASPFTGGAILGDRVRMERHAMDPGVFIRSLSSRGHLGGLSRATGQVVDLLDEAGFDLIIVETVGVGQSELAVCEVADTVLVVLTPESGDSVQAMKAGLLEIADVFVVNKADRPGADRLARELEEAVELDDRPWAAPVRTASATEGRGLDETLAALDSHGAWNEGEGRADWARRRARGRVRTFLDLVAEAARDRAQKQLDPDLKSRLESGESNPYAAAAAWSG